MNIGKYMSIICVLCVSFAANAQVVERTTTVTVPANSTIVTTPAPAAVPAPPVIVPGNTVVRVPAGSSTTTTSVTTPLKVDANCVCKENEETGIVVIEGASVDPDAAQVPCRCATVKVVTPAQ